MLKGVSENDIAQTEEGKITRSVKASSLTSQLYSAVTEQTQTNKTVTGTSYFVSRYGEMASANETAVLKWPNVPEFQIIFV